MATRLSIHNLIHGGWRTVLSVVGISIAILLIFMQLGFLGAVTDTAVVFYDRMEFDLVASSPDYYNFVDSSRFPRDYLATIQSVEGVKDVQPLHVSLGKWNYEARDVQRGMLIIGLNPDGQTFTDPELKSQIQNINQRGSILVDRTSRPKFLGPENRVPFGEQHLGLSIELNGVASRIAGLFSIGTGLAADGACVVHEDQFRAIIPGYSANQAALGLIQLVPGTDVEDAKRRIQDSLPCSTTANGLQAAVDILTRQEVENRETDYWLQGTPVGFIFFTGAVVAFCVGAIIVYIVLSSDITKQIGEYATLKAMGYKNRYLSQTVLEQAFILAVTSYVFAFAVSLVLYKVVGEAARLPIEMNLTRQIVVFVSSLIMCFLSAMIAMQKLRQADPADLF